MFGSIGFTEILIILVVLLVLFGGRKIPQLAKDLGTGIREFKRSLTNIGSDSYEAPSEKEMQQPPVARKKRRPPKKSSKA